MKRILLSIALPLAIVAAAWQLAPADVELEVELLDKSEPTVAALKLNSRPDFKRLLEDNPDLVKFMVDSARAKEEFGEAIHVGLMGMDGAAMPYLLEILDKSEDQVTREFVCGLLIPGSTYPGFPLEAVVPRLLKIAKSDDEGMSEVAVAVLAQVLHFQGLPENEREAFNKEFRTDGW